MKNIKLLSEDIIKEIAAGEVVKNPASVVKELVENSIDAKSTEIYIEIQNSGKDLIYIRDNGTGMSYEDLLECKKKHATSKIKDIEDVYRVSSLGMRGEALFAIDTVSNFTITSRTSDLNHGFLLEGDQITPVASNIGTIMEVKNLFYNTPARLKFLKSNEIESKLVEEVIESYAVCYSNIQFKFNKNNKIITYQNPIKIAFDYNFSDIIKIQDHIDVYKISGMLLNGLVSYKNMIFVNQRLIKDSKITGIIRKAYREISGKENIPFILFIECPFDLIDVNVHPEKIQIRFSDDKIYGYIFIAIRNALLNCNLIKMYGAENNIASSEINTENSIIKSDINHNEHEKIIQQEKFDNIMQINFHKNYDFDKKQDDKDDKDECCERTIPVTYDNFFYGDLFSKITETVPESYDPSDSIFHDLKPIGQLFYRYILCEKNDNFVIIDQHAAHERIVAEEFNPDVHLILQKLIKPIIVEKRLAEEQIYKMDKIFEFEINDNLLVITAIPSIFTEKHINQFIKNLDDLNKSPKDVIFDYIHEYGCKNAIKSGEVMEISEMQALIYKLKNTSHNMFCNHGRRTTVTIDKNKLDHMFGRNC